jgi:WD40 repeat protein
MVILAAILALGPKPVTTHSKTISITVTKIEEALRPISLAAAPYGPRFVAAMEDGSVRIIDAKTRQTVKMLTKHPDPAYGIAWSPDGILVATGDEKARIYVENVLNGKMEHQYRTHTKGIEKLSFNSTHHYLVSTGKDDFVKVYDLTSSRAKESCSIAGHGLNFYGATCDPKAPYIIAVGDLGTGGEFLDARNGKLSSFIVGHDNQGIYDIAFNPAGTRYVTAGRDGTAILWDQRTGKKVGTMRGHTDWVMQAAFSPNGLLIATSSTDGTVKVWNAYTLEKIADLPHQMGVGGSPLCFTADGSSLITVNDAGNLEFNTITPTQKPALP